MKLASHLPPGDRERVEARLRANLMAWLTTVAAGWAAGQRAGLVLMREDDSILVYSQPGKEKLRNVAGNPKVSFGLDVTDIGRNIVRIEGIARRAAGQPQRRAVRSRLGVPGVNASVEDHLDDLPRRRRPPGRNLAAAPTARRRALTTPHRQADLATCKTGAHPVAS